MEDEWQTVQKVTRRRRPQRRRKRQTMPGTETSTERSTSTAASACHGHGHTHKPMATKFFEKAVAAQLRATVDTNETVPKEEIRAVLDTCLAELRGSRYWESLKQVLRQRVPTCGSIVCYGIGNFGTKRPSAPLWQLAMAVLMREQFCSESSQESFEMHYFEPLMKDEESKVLHDLDIKIIEENERGRRSLGDSSNEDNNEYDNSSSTTTTLFFMPHCPMSLYTNLFHTNWNALERVVIFGNSLNNYIDGGNASIVTDPHKQQELKILETLQPYWTVDQLPIHRKDTSELSAYFEQAFNDSSLTSFATTNTINSTTSTTTTTNWPPERPQLNFPANYDGAGEVL